MLNQPQFRSHFHLEAIATEAVCLLSERQSVVLPDPLQQLLATLIQQQLTVDAIVDAIVPQLVDVSAPLTDKILAGARVYHALLLLQQQGYVLERAQGLSAAVMAVCDALNLDYVVASQRLQNTRVAVTALGHLSKTELVTALADLQIAVIEETAANPADLEVVLAEDYLQADLEQLNQVALQTKRPWMLVKPVGTIVWLGPVFVPGTTSCWDCLAHRLRLNRPIEAYLQRYHDKPQPLIAPNPPNPAVLQTAWGFAALEVLQWILQDRQSRLTERLITVDPLFLKLQDHVVVRRPQCPVCGDPGLSRQLVPLILGNRSKQFTTDGGHRVMAPGATFQKYRHLISPITGVVQELTALSGQFPDWMHVYLARHAFAVTLGDVSGLCRTLVGRGAGKGLTEMQAKTSGLCEAIERYSGLFQGDEPRIRASYQELGEKAIHPNACMNFSPSQYDNFATWNAANPGLFQQVPAPFDETQEIEWTPIWSLTQQDFRYLPTALCYFGYPRPDQPSCWADSNGCAAGNTLEEAILQAVMEWVERDSVAIWWYNRLSRPSVDLASFVTLDIRAMQDYYCTLHREFWVLDLTSDLGIPTFAAISRRTDRPVEDIVLGYGAHLDPTIALSRALTEMNQILVAVLQANEAGESQYPALADAVAIQWWRTATLANQPYLAPAPQATPTRATDYPHGWSHNLLEDVQTCQRLIEQKGMELLVLDQTRPDIGLKVVRVFIPGMRHFWKRLGPGRLYEVPVQRGWLPAPIPEHQLNPIPMWM